MITHVVLFTPKGDLTGQQRIEFADAFVRAVRATAGVRTVRIGRRTRHGAGYERGAGESGEYAAIIEFETIEDLKTYLEHPAHAAVSAYFRTALESAAVYDYEMGSLETLPELI